MTCADCGKPLAGQVCETDNPRPGRITVRYQGRLSEKCYRKRKRAGKRLSCELLAPTAIN